MFAVPDNTLATPQRDAAPRHAVRVALEFAADRGRWRHLLRYDPERRFAALIEGGRGQEVWLMGWLPGQHTDLHDHGHTSGAFTVVSGTLTETVARRGSGGAAELVHALDAGQSRVFGPGYVHHVANEGPDPAISVHVYRWGTRTMRPYHLDPVDGPVRD